MPRLTPRRGPLPPSPPSSNARAVQRAPLAGDGHARQGPAHAEHGAEGDPWMERGRCIRAPLPDLGASHAGCPWTTPVGKSSLSSPQSRGS